MMRLARLESHPRRSFSPVTSPTVPSRRPTSKLREIVEPAAAEIGAEVVWVMGNHDERVHYARELFGEDVADDETQDRVHDVDGSAGDLAGHQRARLPPRRDLAAQLGWLGDQLSTPAPHGTLLAMHHPPIPVPMVRAAEVIELHDQHLLGRGDRGHRRACASSAGHFHFSSYSTFAGVPVSVASSTCYLADPAPIGRLLSAVDGHQSVTMMHFYEDRVVHSVVPVPEAEEKAGYPLELVEQIEALPPARASRARSPRRTPRSGCTRTPLD